MEAQSETTFFFLGPVDFSVLLLIYIKFPSTIRPIPCLSWIVILKMAIGYNTFPQNQYRKQGIF